MNYTIVVLPEAEDDSDNAYWWYEEQQTGLGDSFLDEISDYYHAIIKDPFAFGWYDKHNRRAILKRFPFIIIYEVIAEDIVVNSVFHTSRKPKRKST